MTDRLNDNGTIERQCSVVHEIRWGEIFWVKKSELSLVTDDTLLFFQTINESVDCWEMIWKICFPDVTARISPLTRSRLFGNNLICGSF